MLRSYRYALIALFGCLTLASAASAQNGAQATTNSQQINSESQGRAQRDDRTTANTVAPANVANGEDAVQPDCGTPKECRAEQREKDDLVAQQTAAEAAVSQRNAAWWQTGVGAAGVILLILTVIYTHLATRAAIDSVKVVTLIEGAKPIVSAGRGICETDGENTTLRLLLSNAGRTMGVIKETCLQGSKTGLHADFVPSNVKRHNYSLSTTEADWLADEISFLDDEYKFVVGYYKVQTVFSKKLLTDYFCFELSDIEGLGNEEGRMVGTRLATYRVDLDWPHDETV